MDQHLADLERVIKQIREVEERMEAATQGDPITQRLLGEKGIGLVTAVTGTARRVVRAEIGSFRRFQSGKQLARYCAVTPKNVGTAA